MIKSPRHHYADTGIIFRKTRMQLTIHLPALAVLVLEAGLFLLALSSCACAMIMILGDAVYSQFSSGQTVVLNAAVQPQDRSGVCDVGTLRLHDMERIGCNAS